VLRQNSKTLKVLHQRKSLGNPGLELGQLVRPTVEDENILSFYIQLLKCASDSGNIRYELPSTAYKGSYHFIVYYKSRHQMTITCLPLFQFVSYFHTHSLVVTTFLHLLFKEAASIETTEHRR
jgi:hypothetical protein